MNSAVLDAGQREVLLGHVRRWKSDKNFFQQARKQFTVTDVTSILGRTDNGLASNSKGALRVFSFKPKS